MTPNEAIWVTLFLITCLCLGIMSGYMINATEKCEECICPNETIADKYESPFESYNYTEFVEYGNVSGDT